MRGTLRAVGNEMVLTLRENEPLRIAHETWKREANGRKQQTTANVPSAESTTDDGAGVFPTHMSERALSKSDVCTRQRFQASGRPLQYLSF